MVDFFYLILFPFFYRSKMVDFFELWDDLSSKEMVDFFYFDKRKEKNLNKRKEKEKNTIKEFMRTVFINTNGK